jgi:hypothetical protein
MEWPRPWTGNIHASIAAVARTKYGERTRAIWGTLPM